MKVAKNTQVLAGVLALLVLLSSCGGSVGTAQEADDGGGTGVSVGASKEEWIAAFEGVDPIELRAQSPYPDDPKTGAWWNDYMSEITEWSGDKISFEVGYSNAFVEPREIPDALEDGRLDLAIVYPHLAAQAFPRSNSLYSSTIYSDSSPIQGTISSNVWPNDVAFQNAEVQKEFEDNGMKALLPYFYPGAGSLFCADKRNTSDDLQGSVVSASSVAAVTQVEALGATATSLEFSEYYEGLQRGVVDCVQTTPGALSSTGVLEVAPHAVIDPDRSFVSSAIGIAMSEATWDEMPLVAQQLIWDKISTLIYGNVDSIWSDYVTISDASVEAGGELMSFDSSVDAGFEQAAKSIEDGLEADGGSELLESAASSSRYWQDSVDLADFGSIDGFGELSSWLSEENKSAVKEYISGTVYDEIFSPQRPE